MMRLLLRDCYRALSFHSVGYEHSAMHSSIPLKKMNAAGTERYFSTSPSAEDIKSGKWYPKRISDLDYICNNIIMYDPTSPTGLDADHASFKDKEYRKRREWFWDIANDYKHGHCRAWTSEGAMRRLTRAEFQGALLHPYSFELDSSGGTPIPWIDYTAAETRTWGTIYRDLKALHQKLACKEFLDNFKLLEQHCGYSEKCIPQLQDISDYLKTRTGFILRPCGGYLTPRDFLGALAFRVFCCTQYMRHESNPHYTPEPDLCHEVLGHMAMFMDPEFAQFSQEIGLASLGSSDEDCSALIRLYFFTIEFGLSTEGEKFDEKKRNLKVYGAGLLSCFDELQFCITPDAKVYRFEPDDVIAMEPEVTKYQKGYFYTRNFAEVLYKLRAYIASMKRPFVLRYDPFTQTVQNPTDSISMKRELSRISYDMNQLQAAFKPGDD